MNNNKGLAPSPFSDYPKYVQEFSFFHLAILDASVQCGFRVILKIVIGNLCKPLCDIIDIIIMPISIATLSLKTFYKKQENCKYLSVSRTKRAFLVK